VRASPVAVGSVGWHDVECASYGADLPLWRALAEERGGPVLDLGAGTGRVALDLAARGVAVTALDADPELVGACNERARAAGLAVRAVPADVRSFELGAQHPLAILPMQVAQLLGGERGRAAMLATVRRHLTSGGLLAAALADPFEGGPVDEVAPPLPDVLEIEGWVLSSTPVEVRVEGDRVAIDRHRQAVSPAGELTEEVFTVHLDTLTARGLEGEAAKAGFTVLPAVRVPATRDHVGSTVVMTEAP
jgi:SAM-dependent methyltransferase